MSEKESIGYWDGSDKPGVVVSRHWGSGPVPPNTLRNQDGTPYSAGSDDDWEELSNEQRAAINALRGFINKHLTAEIEVFYKRHPELKLDWQFVCNVLIRGKMIY